MSELEFARVESEDVDLEKFDADDFWQRINIAILYRGILRGEILLCGLSHITHMAVIYCYSNDFSVCIICRVLFIIGNLDLNCTDSDFSIFCTNSP